MRGLRTAGPLAVLLVILAACGGDVSNGVSDGPASGGLGNYPYRENDAVVLFTIPAPGYHPVVRGLEAFRRKVGE